MSIFNMKDCQTKQANKQANKNKTKQNKPKAKIHVLFSERKKKEVQ